jgi:hypothetical protein
MTFDQLNSKHGVAVLRHQNDYGLISVGNFPTYEAAELYVQDAQTVEGCFLLEPGRTIHPPRETDPEFAYMNQEADKEKRFKVIVRVPSLAQSS